MGRFTSGSNTSGVRKKSICAACTVLRCGRIDILGLALKELIGGRTAVLGPTYKKTLLLSTPAGSAEPHCWDMRLINQEPLMALYYENIL